MPSVLVLSKRYDPPSLEHAASLRQKARVRLLLDLCDNHFHHHGDDRRLKQRADALRTACRMVDQVVVASQALAEAVRTQCPDAQVLVIPDAVEPPFMPAGWQQWREPRAEWRLRRFALQLQRAGAAYSRRLVWFGNHGSVGTDGGMADLLAIRAQLEQAHVASPISLSVVSNNEEKFRSLTAGWRLPCLYLPWHGATFSRALRLHSACVIPVGLNPFTRCKTNNRVATALLHGLNVVATRIPSYDEFSACVVLDDWPAGLGAYLSDAPRRARDVQAGQQILEQRYSVQAVAAQWKMLLTDQGLRSCSDIAMTA